MMYYTFEGSYEEIKSIVVANYKNVLESDKEIDAFVDALLAISQGEMEMSIEHYSSMIIDHGMEESAKLLWGDTQYDVKISVIAFEIFSLLVKVLLGVYGKTDVELISSVIKCAIGLYKKGIHKIDDKAYCVYKKILSEAYKRKCLKIDYSSIANQLKVSLCDTDFYEGGRCPYLANDNEQCKICDEDINNVLEKLDKQKLIKYENKVITILL